MSDSRCADSTGFVSTRVDEFAYKTTFELAERRGDVVLNLSALPRSHIGEAMTTIRKVMEAGFGMGRLLCLENGHTLFPRYIDPSRCIVIGTVCGITLNGILRSRGIPMNAKFGGLIEVVDRKPVRFTQIINYDATTIDPIEIFIKGKMTRVFDAADSGNGTIGASLREIPAIALGTTMDIMRSLERIGLCSVLAVGKPGRALLDVPVTPGRVGMLVAAGLNPIAAIEERGIPTESVALSALSDFNALSAAY